MVGSITRSDYVSRRDLSRKMKWTMYVTTMDEKAILLFSPIKMNVLYLI